MKASSTPRPYCAIRTANLPEAVIQRVPGSREQGIDQRIKFPDHTLWDKLRTMRNQARRDARFTAAVLLISSGVFAIMCIGIGCWFISYGQISHQGPIVWSLQKWLEISADLIVIICYGIFGWGSLYIFITTNFLYRYHYRETWRLLQHSNLALVLCGDQFLDELLMHCNHDILMRFAGVVRPRTIEQQLDLCCYMVRALRAEAQHKPPTKVWRLARQGYTGPVDRCFFTNRPVFYLLLMSSVLTLGVLFITIMIYAQLRAPSYLASRAVLVAFLDFMLEEPPPWVDELKPPENIKRPWWWRSVAPLLKG
jgi:hypothetical protein